MPTILAVDDDAGVLQLIVRLLGQAGYRILTASNGLEALQVYESYAPSLDLVLTDVDMPEMNGLELAARIHSAHPSAKVLLMSGGVPADLGDVLESRSLLRKPFRPHELVAAIQGACRQ